MWAHIRIIIVSQLPLTQEPHCVNQVMKVWIAQRVTELLGIEDDVLIAYIYEQLEGHKVGLISIICFA